jgi:predicted Fe-S protein YdhL (DUF1289 family)
MAPQVLAKGVCPDCGRVISGRATGIEYDHADRRFVILRPHNREERTRHPAVCLARGARRVVPRIRD